MVENPINYKTLTRNDVLEFTAQLSTRNPFHFTQKDLRLIREWIDSDGCTGVLDFYVCSCYIHDFYYRTHRDFFGVPISKKEADTQFRLLIQNKSWWKRLSLMSYWRWMGVGIFGGNDWEMVTD